LPPSAPAGSRHRIEYVDRPGGWTNWLVMGATNWPSGALTLPASPYLFLDEEGLNAPPRVYRTTPLP
jgi:hypothetical protein